MKVLIVSSKANNKRIISDALSELSIEIEVENLNEENCMEDNLSWDYNFVVIDDSTFPKYNYQAKALVFSNLLKSKVPTIVILDEKDRVDVYCGLNLVDYFIAPIDWQRVQLRIKVIEQELTSTKKLKPVKVADKFVIKNKNEVMLVNYDQIRFFEKDGKKLLIHLENEVVTVYESIKELITRIPINFVRVHNSYVVNTKYISKILEVGNRSYHIMFTDYDKIAHMSRYMSEALLKDYYKLTSGDSVRSRVN